MNPFQNSPDSESSQAAQSQTAPSRPLDAGLLRTVYLDLLGRPPLRAEAEEWKGKDLAQLVAALTGSLEFWQTWVDEQLYYFFLIDNFRPRSERVAEAPEALWKKRADVRDVLHRICISSSFEQRNPGADTFVTVVMEQLLGLEVQRHSRELEIGKLAYDGGTGLFLGQTASSQAHVVKIAIEDKRFEKHLMGREHERLLRVRPSTRDLGKAARRVRKDPRSFLGVLREWILSDLYVERLALRRALPNRMFVRALFVDLLDRLPTADEAEPLREALDGLSDPGPLRSVVARTLLDGPLAEVPSKEDVRDPKLWITECFRRTLGRDPASQELEAFSATWAQPACRPSTVLYALLSSAEYAMY
ncbi:MAG: hypothetical protein AAF368_09015 [Planctomycetota bacterium]